MTMSRGIGSNNFALQKENGKEGGTEEAKREEGDAEVAVIANDHTDNKLDSQKYIFVCIFCQRKGVFCISMDVAQGT